MLTITPEDLDWVQHLVYCLFSHKTWLKKKKFVVKKKKMGMGGYRILTREVDKERTIRYSRGGGVQKSPSMPAINLNGEN